MTDIWQPHQDIRNMLRRRLEGCLIPQSFSRLSETYAREDIQSLNRHPKVIKLQEGAELRRLMGVFRYQQRGSEGLTYDELANLGKARPYYERMLEKLELYIVTGNWENLMDVLNYVKLEVARPSHPNHHFESTERYDD
jgi:hypothetical protein